MNDKQPKKRNWKNPLDDIHHREDAGPVPKSMEWLVEIPLGLAYKAYRWWYARRNK